MQKNGQPFPTYSHVYINHAMQKYRQSPMWIFTMQYLYRKYSYLFRLLKAKSKADLSRSDSDTVFFTVHKQILFLFINMTTMTCIFSTYWTTSGCVCDINVRAYLPAVSTVHVCIGFHVVHIDGKIIFYWTKCTYMINDMSSKYKCCFYSEYK